MPGRLLHIYIAPTAGQPMQRVEACRALGLKGLQGDRYAAKVGSFSRWDDPGRQVTFIAREALDAAVEEYGVDVHAGEHRRNLVVQDVPLDALINVPFSIGEVEFVGIRPCAPCKYLVRVSGQDEICTALKQRGGLRATVLTSGTLRVGDPITWDPADIATRPHLPG